MIKVNDLQKGKKNRYIVTLNENEYDVNENLILNYHLIKGYVIEDDKVLDDIISDISYYDFYPPYQILHSHSIPIYPADSR